MFETKFITFSEQPGVISLVDATIVVDKADYPGIRIAAANLADDFASVTRGKANSIELVAGEHDSSSDITIIIGCVEASPLLARLEKENKIDFRAIRGRWESFSTTVVSNPFDGCSQALVISGSDKRGAIFGVYTLSEQIGVSPYVHNLNL